MADLDPVVGEPDGRRPDDRQHHQGARARPVHPGDHVGGQEPDQDGPDDADPAHGGSARLGDVDLGAVLADLLADVVLEQPADEERGRQHGHPQGDAARGHEGDHRAALRARRTARRGRPPPSTRSSKGTASPPVVCVASWPLPASRTTSPGRAAADRHPDGRRPVGLDDDLGRARHAGTHLAMMAAGSSERGLSEVRTTTSARVGGDRTHLRALARVAVAAAAEQAHHPARRRPAPARRGAPRRGRPGCGRSRPPRPPGRRRPTTSIRPGTTRGGIQAGDDVVLVDAQGGGHGGRHQGVVHVEATRQGQVDHAAPPGEPGRPDRQRHGRRPRRAGRR